ncbi:MAG TPA: 2-hydroxychromene-2-carboxylate isomerase [Myxococcales bacterium]|nr:2-hydroxychromene-2-carboxylate isomerase [Myxococcales bacterium]
MSHVDFYFDFSNPFAYLGSTQIEKVAERAGATMNWKPMFKAVGTPMVPFFELSAQKRKYLSDDMARWAAHWEVPFTFPSNFPMMTIKPLRLAMTLDNPSPFIHQVFSAYWAKDQDISKMEVLAQCCSEAGMDPAILERTGDAAVKQQLIDATDEAVAKGVFGAPTCIVNGQVFWGQDRLQLVEKSLNGWEPPTV